jgi:hypothetical protein
MDPRDRADAALARASARNRWAVTPDNATSPMDAKPTVQIPRVVVNAADPREQDPDTTIVLPGSVAKGQVPVPHQQGQQIPMTQQSQPLPHVQQSQPLPHVQPQQIPPNQQSQPLPHVQPQQQHPQQQHPGQRPDSEQPTKQLPGIIPTTQQTPGRRISLTDRLSGALPETDQP